MKDTKNYYYALDVGGTFIKGGIVSEGGEVLFRTQTQTNSTEKDFDLAKKIAQIMNELENNFSLSKENIKGVGIALPGLIDSKKGIICHSGNLGLINYPLIKKLQTLIDLPIKIGNDADAATLAEQKFGAGKTCENFVFLTIGTGIGGGVVIGGKALSNFANFSGEFGHMKVNTGLPCSCGEVGCFETIASTKALISLAKRKMTETLNNTLIKKVNPSEVDGKTIFKFMDTEPLAKEIFNEYISYLGSGIVSIVNIFAPEKVVIGGAIAGQKKVLTKPLEEYVNSHIYIKNASKKVKIEATKLNNDAGIIGAMCLFLQNS